MRAVTHTPACRGARSRRRRLPVGVGFLEGTATVVTAVRQVDKAATHLGPGGFP